MQTDGATGVNVFISGKEVGADSMVLQTGISGNYEGGIGYRTDGGTVEGEAKLQVAEFRISDIIRYTEDFIPTNNWSLDTASSPWEPVVAHHSMVPFHKPGVRMLRSPLLELPSPFFSLHFDFLDVLA